MKLISPNRLLIYTQLIPLQQLQKIFLCPHRCYINVIGVAMLVSNTLHN